MCGIAGWIEWNNKDGRKAILQQMVDSMSHRGPDSKGLWCSPHAVLGHCRLAVMDPVGGRQPMERNYQGNTAVITYNGEIYNQGELRQELKARGHHFETINSDTETLLIAYLEWGSHCVDKLNGIYAFAIWDAARENLFMARDRLGVKPLFYAKQGDMFLFASELKALLKHPKMQADIDAGGLAEILVMGPGRTPGLGIYKGIFELKPGWSLSLNRQGMHLQQYWRLQSQPHPDNEELTIKHIRQLMQDIVRRQLIADVPQCTLLSGGLDSSLITAFAADIFGPQHPLHTYCIRHEEEAQGNKDEAMYEDFVWARQVAAQLHTVHHEVIQKYEDLHDANPEALRAGDVPGMVDIDTSLLLLCKQIRKHFVVALSGECADEIFGGYPWFHRERIHIQGFPWMNHLEKRMETISPEIIAYIRPTEYQADCWHDAINEVPQLSGESPVDADKRILSYLTITRFMPTLLQRKDRMSMACSLEIRVPFSDHRLVEYTWNIPWHLKALGGENKGILRQAVSHLLPEDIIHRRKSPFPKTVHPGYRQMVAGNLKDVLSEPDSPLKPLLNAEAVDRLITGQNFFSQPWFGQLMGDAQWMAYLIQMDAWMRFYRVAIKV